MTRSNLSYIFYVDDVFLLGEGYVHNIQAMMSVISRFSDMSKSKSQLQQVNPNFPPKTCFQVRFDIASGFSFKTTSSFGKYLGVEIKPHKLKPSHYLGILDKSSAGIKGWQTKL